MNKGKNGSSWKPFFVFTSLNALPLGAIVYYLKRSIEERRSELANISDLLEISPLEAASRIEGICRSCPNTFLVSRDQVMPILPHAPESAPLVLAADDLVNNINNAIPGVGAVFDSLSASRDYSKSTPFRQLHFGLSSDSELAERINSGDHRKVTLVYNGGLIPDVSLSITGNAVVVEDERLRQYYWRDRWNEWIKKDKYILIKIVPEEIRVHSLTGINGISLSRAGDEWVR
jgi:hypothetical protein